MSRLVTMTLPAVTLLILALGPGPTVAADPGAVPPPGKLDTFAQDTWLRRNKYPLQIKLSETEGKGGENVPIILSVACGEGDYPAGKLCPVLASQPLAAQIDVLATWPSDKSVKHALVSLLVPKIGPKESLEFSFTQAAPALPGKFVPAVDLKAMSFHAEFDNPDGKKTVAAIDAGTLGRMADILAGKIAGEEAKKLAPRMCGPVCYEFEVKVPAKTGEADDKEIDVFYRLRLFSGVKGVRVEYDVENTRIPGKPYPLWALLALASDSPLMLHYARLSEGNGMAAYPAHIRPPENGQPGVSWDDPMRLTLYILSNHPENARGLRHAVVGKGNPNSTDNGHVPDVAYYTYLATGEKFYEEEMTFWAAEMLWGDNGHLPSHDRYSAWPLRNATDAAFVLPDNHPMKKYFFDVVQRTIAFQGEAVKDPKVYWSRETRKRQASKDYVCSATSSMWQECFNIWALDNAAQGLLSGCRDRPRGRGGAALPHLRGSGGIQGSRRQGLPLAEPGGHDPVSHGRRRAPPGLHQPEENQGHFHQEHH